MRYTGHYEPPKVDTSKPRQYWTGNPMTTKDGKLVVINGGMSYANGHSREDALRYARGVIGRDRMVGVNGGVNGPVVAVEFAFYIEEFNGAAWARIPGTTRIEVITADTLRDAR